MASVHKRKNSPFWQAKIIVDGEVHRFSTKTRVRSQAAEIAREREEQECLKLESKGGLTLLEASDRFFLNPDLRPRTVAGYKLACFNLYGVLGDFSLRSLTVSQLRSYIQQRTDYFYAKLAEEDRKRQEGKVKAKLAGKRYVERRTSREASTGSVTIRHDLAFLSSLYRSAKSWDPGITKNPVKEIDKSGLKKAREHKRWLTETEVSALLKACTVYQHRLFITLAVDTGMRSGEMFPLRWDQINLTTREVIVGSTQGYETKNGDVRLAFLTQRCVELLQHTKSTQKENTLLGQEHTPWVFQSDRTDSHITTMKTAWAGITRRAGLQGVRIHDLRHTFASWAKQKGLEDLDVQGLMGHKTPSMTKRYAHLSKVSLKNAAKLFEDTQLYT